MAKKCMVTYLSCSFRSRNPPRYLSDARETATPALYVLNVTAATCGLRIGKLTGLAEDSVDLAARVLHVCRMLAGRPKTESFARFFCLDLAVEATRDALRWRKERRLRLGPKYRDCGLLFVGERGWPLNPSNIRSRAHVPRLTRLSLSRFRLHDLRHFHATQLVAAGVDYRTVGGRMEPSVAVLHDFDVRPCQRTGARARSSGC